jgi:NAD(P)-dependent dehydrogenase (short-subunit alcohol dehydrogenase family)
MKTNSRVMIIGGSSGMGLAVAQKLLIEGARVLIVGRSTQRLKAVRDQLGEDRVDIFAADVGERSQVAALFAQLDQFDHVVMTAADLPYAPLAQLTEGEVMRAVRSKLLGPLFVAQECATRINAGGSITFTSGIAARRPMRGGSAAATVNSGLEGLVRALAIELAPVRVNAVSPGWTDTPIWDSMATPEKKREMFNRMATTLPVGRVGRVEDIAETILYLMNSSFSTGTVVDVDGGHRLV